MLRRRPNNKTTLGQCLVFARYAYTTRDDTTCLFYWRTIHGSLDDILGLAVLKFRSLHEIYFLGFYTGINVVLSLFRRLISINVHCIYRRTHIKKHSKMICIICRLNTARGCKMSHLQCSNHLITVWRGSVYWLLAGSRVAE